MTKDELDLPSHGSVPSLHHDLPQPLQAMVSNIQSSQSQDELITNQNAFWDNIKTAAGTPIIEDIPDDLTHKKVTFLWQGPDVFSIDNTVYLALQATFIEQKFITEAERLTNIEGD